MALAHPLENERAVSMKLGFAATPLHAPLPVDRVATPIDPPPITMGQYWVWARGCGLFGGGKPSVHVPGVQQKNTRVYTDRSRAQNIRIAVI